MLKQEVIDELRIAIYEDIGLLWDLYTEEWRDDALRDVEEYVPGITKEELEEYRDQDEPYLCAVLKFAITVASDEALLNGLFDQTPEKAYETVKHIVGDRIPYEDFVDILEYGGKPFFKAFECGIDALDCDAEDELSVADLQEVAGGTDEDRAVGQAFKILEKLLKIVGKAASCFTAESSVHTPSGARPICDIAAGDTVVSLDHEGNMVEARVVGTTGGEAPVIEVHFDDGRIWNTTSTQWFYDGTTSHNVWQHRGGNIVTLDGTARITDIVETGRKEAVYDLVLEGTNIMFINGVAAESYES